MLLYLTILTGKNSILLMSVQEFIEIYAWLLLTFFYMLTQSTKSHTFHCRILKIADV